MRYLFFPVEIGLAHICRSLAIADELVSRGNDVFVALSERKHHLFTRSLAHLIPIHSYIDSDDFGMDVRQFRNTSFLGPLIDEELAIIDRVQPDSVVVDFRISALAASLIRGVKCYALFVGDALPYGSLLPNPGVSPRVFPFLRRLMQTLYDRASRLYVSSLVAYVNTRGVTVDFDQWMRQIDFIVPEHVSYMPASTSRLHVHYVGTLGWYGFDYPVPEWIDSITPDGNTIYVSFGGTGFDTSKLIEIARALVDSGYRVVVTTGTLCDPGSFPLHPRLFVTRFIPGNIISSRVDVVVCHGGYGTVMDAIQHGVPAVCVPFNPDQIIHAARFQELGCVKSLWDFQLSQMFDILTFRWDRIEQIGKRISTTRVVSAVKSVLDDFAVYSHRIKAFNNVYLSTDGPREAADIIEGLS